MRAKVTPSRPVINFAAGMAGADFSGTERFVVIRRLGEGGMGIVYEADDRQRGHRVALKTFKSSSSENLYWFKREFRTLADLSHPNLVDLYDLVSDADSTFFTMELVVGEDFSNYCHARTPSGGLTQTPSMHVGETMPVSGSTIDSAPTMGSGEVVDTATPAPVVVGAACDETRLRSGLIGLARGLDALHRAGKLHRDIKPSNVVVTPDDRVVLLDFGLARDISFGDDVSHDGRVIGTPAYMSPEQAAGEADIGPASDWYSVGVLMYQALTRTLPFTGPLVRVLSEKQHRIPDAPRALAPGVSRELSDLCIELMSIDPGTRPSAGAVLARLGAASDTAARPHAWSLGSESVPFTGREDELARMTAAYERLEAGAPGAVLVRGASGMGKTGLIKEFVDRIRNRRGEVVRLEGRCYEREDIPYKAIDSLVDHLSAHWRRLPRADAAELLPRDASYLARLFPVLGRVPVVAEAPRRLGETDPQQVRNRAFAAFRELLQRLGDRGPVVLFLDDLQWVDSDTVTLLADVLRPPDPPLVMLVLAARRAEDAGKPSALLDSLLARVGMDVDTIDLEPLSHTDSAELAAHFLGRDHDELVARVAAESAGSPFFVAELARYLTAVGDVDIATVNLDDVLARRVDSLPGDARALLEAVVVAGEPVSREVLARVVDTDPATLRRESRALSAASFLRSTGGRKADRLAPYHDRIREVVLRELPRERRVGCHRSLAVALVEHDGTNEQLARHWYGAGEHARAAGYARGAGDEATAKLDFDRAAEFYRLALELGDLDADERRALHTELAEALANAGRPADAARAFDEAAAAAHGSEQLELRRRTAEQLLRGGYLDEGLEAVRVALEQVGIRLARTPGRAMVSLLWHRAWVRLRGVRWRHRDADSVPARSLTRADVAWTVSLVLSMVDHIRGAEIQSRHLLLALRMGEPARVGRALAMEAAYLGTQGAPKRGKVLAARAKQLAADTDDPYVLAMHHGAMGALVGYAHCDWRASLEQVTRSDELFRAHHQAAGWETDTINFFVCENKRMLGEVADLCQRVPKYVREAERRGDRYAQVNLRTRFSTVFLAADAPDAADADLHAAVDSWIPASRAYLVQHYYALHSWCEIHLYRGDPDAGAALVREQLRPLKRSFLLTLPAPRAEFQYARGRIAVARGDLGAARGFAAKLRRSKIPLAGWLGSLLAASIAAAGGDDAAAAARLREVLPDLSASETRLFEAAARRKLGALLGGDDGAALVAEADAFMTSEGVRDPARMAAMLVV